MKKALLLLKPEDKFIGEQVASAMEGMLRKVCSQEDESEEMIKAKRSNSFHKLF